MLFVQKVKDEIIKKKVENDCCLLSTLAGIIQSIGSVEISQNQITFSCLSENDNLLFYIQYLIEKRFAYKFGDVYVFNKYKGPVVKKEMTIPFDIGEQILLECGIINRKEGHLDISQEIDHHLIIEDCCKKSYIAGLFLGSGTISIPNKNSSGYHLEIELSNYYLAHEIMELLADVGILAKMVERKNMYIVYIKESDAICDLLVMMRATGCSLELQNEKVKRELNNNINRKSNFQSANIDKAVASAVKEVLAIQTIAETVGLDSLDNRLKKVAEARLNYPELSLMDLLSKIDEPLTKSGLRFRMEKIISLAKDINGG